MTFFLPVAASQYQQRIRQYIFKDILFDFSRQMISDAQLNVLITKAHQKKLTEAISQLQSGLFSNNTEHRLVNHTALRVSNAPLAVVNTLARMESFSNAFHNGEIRGYSGKPLKQIICIGVGGSDLGSRLVVEALYHLRKKDIAVFHVSNLDATDLKETLDQINVEESLFIIASKTFSTAETMANFNSICDWAVELLHCTRTEFVEKHVVGVTANPSAALAVGVAPLHIFEFWDWVGGRFSLWSAVGLPIALALGMDHFKQLLAGAAALDEHFFSTPLLQNIPVIQALIGIWNIDQFDSAGLSISPYSHRLRSLSKYLQQLEMESNGKRLKNDGTYVASHTAPIVFGDAGTNGQHAYFQMLHQGTRHIPTDFIAVIENADDFDGHHNQLLANCFAQSEALAHGRINEVASFKSCAGGQRSTTILLPQLTPFNLGILLATYEHKVFVQAHIWGINAFDQWGVELGKNLAKDIHQAMLNKSDNSHLNPVTQNLIAYVEKIRADLAQKSDSQNPSE